MKFITMIDLMDDAEEIAEVVRERMEPEDGLMLWDVLDEEFDEEGQMVSDFLKEKFGVTEGSTVLFVD